MNDKQMSYNHFLHANAIYLREVRETDVNADYYHWINDPQVNQFLETRYTPRSIQDIKSFVNAKDSNPNEPFFAICCSNTDKHIGNIKLGPINWQHRRADISLLIGDKSFWGKGVASQAIGLIVKFAFETLNLNKLQAGAYHPNIGSIKAFKNNGFEQEGYVKELCFANNQAMDMVLMGLTYNEYLKNS